MPADQSRTAKSECITLNATSFEVETKADYKPKLGLYISKRNQRKSQTKVLSQGKLAFSSIVNSMIFTFSVATKLWKLVS